MKDFTNLLLFLKMKIRNGFVSNSSSMSFTVSKDKYKTVKELAKAMMDYRAEIDDWYKDEGRHKQDTEALEKMVNPNQAIVFYTCNYDTYIYDAGDKFCVDTCNNHNWWMFLDKHSADFEIVAEFYHLNQDKFVKEKIYGNYWD